MQSPPDAPPPAEVAAQRAALGRSIRRASLAGVLALAVVVALACGVAWKARQSEQQAARADAEAARATQARAEADAQLWNARLNEARAIRIAGGPGARTRAAAIVADLARPPGLSETQRLALRSEAIAQFALLDVVSPTNWTLGELDASVARDWFVMRRRGPEVEVRAFADSNVVARLRGPAENGTSYFSPRGTFVATTFRTTPISLMVWRTVEGGVVFSNTVPEGTFHGAQPPVFSPKEEVIAVSTPGALELRSLSDGLLLRRRAPVTACAFSPDARWLACAVGSEIVVEDTRTGERWTRLDTGFGATQVAWRPLGDVLGLAGENGVVGFADLPAPGSPVPVRLRTTEGQGSLITYAGFSPDGSALLTTSWDGFSIFWDALTGRRLLAESRQLLSNLGTPNQRALAARSYPSRSAVAGVVGRGGYRVVAALPPRPAPPGGINLSADGRWLAVDNARCTTLFEAQTGSECARFTGVDPEFAADGKTLWTCAGDRVLRYEVDSSQNRFTGTNLLAGDLFLRTPPGTRANSLSLAPGGRTLLVCASDHTVLVVDAANGMVQREVAVPAHYARLAPDGETLLTQFHNGPAYLIRLGSTNHPTPLGNHLNTRFDGTGRRLGLATEQFLSLYQRNASNRWEQQHRIALETGAGAPPPFAFSPDGRLLAVVFNRFDVQLYDPETARLLAVLNPAFPAQISGTAGLTFSADDRELLALKQDGEVVAWKLPVLREELARLGLDWDAPALPAITTAPVRAVARPDFWVPAAALAGALALLAGVVVLALQRRMLAAYERAADLAGARQRKLVEAQLALAQSQKLEALGTLAAGIAHDFNNLLSVIRMSNHFVARAVKAEGATRENLEAIERAATQGRDLVRSMLGYARRADDQASEFVVSRVVGDMMGMLSRQFLSGLTVSLELDPVCPPVLGSSARLEQMLLNLVINASEAMHGKGRLVVVARLVSEARPGALPPAPAARYVELSVADNGPGIPPEHLARVFEPFFTTKVGGLQPGTGLGLSVVYTLAKQGGWGLEVVSQPGAGAVFRVWLPVGAAKAK